MLPLRAGKEKEDEVGCEGLDSGRAVVMPTVTFSSRHTVEMRMFSFLPEHNLILS